ncbi:MAG: RICIN domain-containing protein [Bacteroidales bacterium]|nr:RICIN domain-containing protein [Bacteroidales bacterium]
MKKFVQKSMFVVLIVCISTINAISQRVVGYVPSWTGAATDIQYAKVTHLVYAFVVPNASGDGSLGAIENTSKLQQIVSLAHSNGVKVSIAVGGWTDLYNPGFNTLSGSATGRSNFANNLLNLCNQYGLDGVDIDWEFPEGYASNYEAMMQTLSSVLHGSGKILTAAVTASDYYGKYITNPVFGYVDFLNIMAYDGDAGAGHSPYSLAVSALNYWTGRGLPAGKAVLGVPFYARPSWKTFAQLVAEGADPNADYFNGDYYNGKNTIRQKSELAKNYGGIMIWQIAGDATGDNSLLNVVYDVIGSNNNGVTGLNGTYLLQNRYSGLYLDVDDGQINNDGANVQQWSKTNAANQQFRFTDLGNGVYQIICVASGKSIDISGVSTNDGANVHQWSYVGGANQKFVVKDAGGGYYKLVASHSNKIVEVAGFSTSTGGNIQQWTDVNQTSGQWRLEPVGGSSLANGTYVIQNRYSGLYLDVDANTINQDGANVQQWQLYNTTNQKFTIANLGGNLYSIISVASGKSLDVSGASTANGANVQQWSYVAVPQQQFTIVPVDGAYYKIIASHSNKLVEVAGFNTSNGGNIQQWEDAGQLSGHWQFISASGLKYAEEMDRIDVELTLYPNPAEDVISISFPENLEEELILLHVYDMKGTLIYSERLVSVMGRSTVIDVSAWNTGIYNLNIIMANQQINKKLIIK